ncbi:hypothetical protein, partial [Escherichia coli]|uniref:hypothetical protein n=1 Tax=Escherichia coli TaxID=562 RepID=UPI001BB00052
GSIPLSSTKFQTLAAKRGFLSLPFAAFVIQSISWQCRVVNASLTEKTATGWPLFASRCE